MKSAIVHMAVLTVLLIFPQRGTGQPTPVDLGTLDGDSWATVVNARGHVAGNSPSQSHVTHGFLWTPAGGMVDLGTLGGTRSTVRGLNDNDQVVGESTLAANAAVHAFLWTQAGGMIDLGTLGGPHSVAFAVDSTGQVVGVAENSLRNGHAFLWTAPGGMVDLGTLGGTGYLASTAYAVNDSGQVVGDSYITGNVAKHAFSWTQDGGMIDLGTLGGTTSSAVAVNARGQVVGNSTLANGDVHAFLWTAAGGMVDLGTLGGSTSSLSTMGHPLNDNGQVVGFSSLAAPPVEHAFLWTEAEGMIDLGTLAFPSSYSWASGVNANGQVVGSASTAEGPNHAFSWTPARGMVDLGTLGGLYSGAFTMNDRGQVVGHSTLPGGVGHATLWNVATVAPVSVAPDAGSGVRQVFTLQYSDTLGATDLSAARVRFGAADVGTGSCTIDYRASTALVRIQDDTGTWGEWTPLGSGTLANSQCALHLASSSAAPIDTTLTIIVDVSFTSRFTGTKTISMMAASSADSSANTGWVTRGTWTVPAAVVEASSVTPESGSGVAQLFTLTYSDSYGVTADLSAAQVRFGTGNAAAGSCTVHYSAITDLVRVQDDAGTWEPWTPFGSGTLSNSQCTLDLAQSTATPADTTLSLALQLAFKASFAGAKSVFMRASSAGGQTSGWQPRGSWTVPLAHVEATSVSPDAGSGAAQLFTLAYADSEGVTNDLSAAQFRVSADAAGSCIVHYNAMTALVRMQSDAGAWGSWTPFGSGSLSNGQCTLDLTQSSAAASGTALTLNLHVTFAPGFAGAKTIFMRATSASGPTTGWLSRGTWTVGAIVEALSVTPGSGTGMTRTFTAAYGDSLGVTNDLKSAQVRFGLTNVAPGTCTIVYNAISGLVRLLDDSGVGGSWTPFGSGTLANSQCTLHLADSSALASGTALTLNLRLTFKAAFLGAKSVYLRAISNFGTTTTGWVTRGAWTVGALVQAISVTPNSGSGTTQSFALAYSDGEGVATDLKAARVRFAGTGLPQCTVDYNAITALVRVQKDDGSWWPAVPFGNGSLANSYCTLDLTQSSAAAGGTDLTLTLRLTFSSAFAGMKTIDLRANSAVGSTTGWVTRGSWDPTSFRVSGTVSDGGNLNQLAGSTLALVQGSSSVQAATGFAGEFSLAAVRGAATLTVGKPGYETRVLSIDVQGDASLDVRLVRVVGRQIPCGDGPDTGNRVLALLSRPFTGDYPLTNYFDHDLPGQAGNLYQLNYCDEQISGRIDGHRGYDWVMPEGTPLLALSDGVVTYAGTDPPFYCDVLGRVVSDQRFIEVLHPALEGEQFSSVLVHLSRIDVGIGQAVTRGQAIGLSGNTGCSTEPHVHLHVWRFTHTRTGRPTIADPYGWEGVDLDPWSQFPTGSASIWLWRPGEAPALHPR